MKNRVRVALVLMAAFSSQVLAQERSVSFSHKNWELVCDNTNACRAAGYSDDESESSGSVLITRLAGPCCGQLILATALDCSRNSRSDSFGVKPPLYQWGLSSL